MSSRILCSLALLVSLAAARPPPRPIVGAGCIIKVGDDIVMVRDIWSRRWSLPGGSARRGEAPAGTATRQTLEETGLPVRAHAHVGAAANGFRIYACTPLAGDLALDAGGYLPLPVSAHGELLEARLLDPRRLPRRAWRFPRQRQQVLAMVAATPALTELAVAKTEPPRGALAAELRLTHLIRELALPGLLPALALLGELGSVLALGAIVAWTWQRRGWRVAVEDIALVLVACLSGCLLRHLWVLPRPWHLEPALLRAPTSLAFGLPAGRALIVALVAGLAARRRRGARAWAAAAVLCAGVGLAGIAQGSAFAHDVLAAWLFAGGALGLHGVTRQRLGRRMVPLPIWAGLGAALAAATLAGAAEPAPLAYAATALGLALGICALPPAAQPRGSAAARWGLTLLLGFALVVLATAAEPLEGTHAACVAHQLVFHLALGLLLPLSDALARRLWGTAREHGTLPEAAAAPAATPLGRSQAARAAAS